MLLQPIDYSLFPEMLAWPSGWAEIGLTVASLLIAYLVDRRIARRAAVRLHAERLGGVARIAFPLIALVLLYVSTWIVRRWFGPPFLLDIAIALMIALVVMRGLVYLLRRLFMHQTWLRPWEQAIGGIVWFVLLLYFLGILSPLVEALDRLEIPIGRTHPTVLSILSGIAVVLAAVVFSLWISGLVEARVDRISHLDGNLRAVIVRVVRVALLALAILMALQGIGFDLTLLTVFGGALGVGIGLGLQKLASNYIAGFTILLDRSIRIGDMITVDNRTGVVSKATSRYVVVRSADGVEAIVPNETLVTTTVLNHSYTSPDIRLAVQVQVAYDSAVDKALALLVDLALREPRVLRGPLAPQAFLVGFADSGITLELGVWINDPQAGQLNLRSALNRAILREFAANGIAIPFPQREVRIVGDKSRVGDDFPGVTAPPVQSVRENRL
jgi:small-conductance mechanosensitive channel